VANDLNTAGPEIVTIAGIKNPTAVGIGTGVGVIVGVGALTGGPVFVNYRSTTSILAANTP
jgi:hypothetical protein